MCYRLRTLMFAIFSCLVVAGVGVGVHHVTRPIEFSPSTWRAYPGQRPRMVRDLFTKRPLEDKSRAEVEALLGESDPSSNEDRLIYWAGVDGIDDMWLEVSFREGTVVGVKYYPD